MNRTIVKCNKIMFIIISFFVDRVSLKVGGGGGPPRTSVGVEIIRPCFNCFSLSNRS